MICPEENLHQAWLSLATHWDSEWYEAIAHYGYINIDGPEHTGLLNANVVFFPGYPYLARVLVVFFGIEAKIALLIISQTATFLFWWLFFLIVQRVIWHKQILAALLIAAFPTSWFMFAGYSESCFLLSCCLMLWLATDKRWFFSSISAAVMTATRIIGMPVLIAPLLSMSIMQVSPHKPWFRNRRFYGGIPLKSPATYIVLIGSFGCIAFLGYCAMQFGSWHLYFDMERIGWKGTADPFFLFKTATWLPPPWGYDIDLAPILPNRYGHILHFDIFRLAAYTFSETLVPIFLWLCILFTSLIFKKNRYQDQRSLTWYFAAILMFFFVCFSLSTRHYESMSRCLYPVWILLIISDVLHPTHICFFRLRGMRLALLMTGVIILSAGFWLQLLNRFFLGWWVA